MRAKSNLLLNMKTVEARIEGDNLALNVVIPRLDASTAPEFKKEIESIWKPGITGVAIDLFQLDFIDSSGVGALLNLYKRLTPANQIVKLQRVKPAVQAVIELLRLHRIFEIEA